MSFKSQESLPNTVLMEEAGLKSLILCTLDHKNTFNKIFGGFIMRKAVLEIHPQDPHVFGPPGSGSISQRYGSGSDSGSFPFLVTVLSGLK
jgi:hypothetical protein